MQRLLPCLLILLFFSGCGTSPVNSETTREVVLQYLGGAAGTAGPYFKGGKKELDVLNAADRRKAESLIDDGAALFLVYGANQPGGQTGVSRVILVQRDRVVGDFQAVPKAATAP